MSRRDKRIDRVILVRDELSDCADKLRAEGFTSEDLADGSASLLIKLLCEEHGPQSAADWLERMVGETAAQLRAGDSA